MECTCVKAFFKTSKIKTYHSLFIMTVFVSRGTAQLSRRGRAEPHPTSFHDVQRRAKI